LTIDGLRWAFTTGHASNWHPLTWLSHMLDCQLFGLDAGRHHFTNLLLHIANTLLLFAVFRKMTGTVWQSGFVAAAFGLHPLHVESVAWIAERKDVLSTLFWILTMWAYVRYVKEPKEEKYLLMILFFALGLMAKPMLVTLPFVLLLLDYWPLERIGKIKISRLVVEKAPLFIFSGISSVITFFVQRSGGAVPGVDVVSLNIRIFNALVSYVKYIFKMFWPRNLAVYYPHPMASLAIWQVILAAVVLVVVSILVICLSKRNKYLLTGWLWYLGTLVPVIGFVQVGSQSMADRYTYVPFTGLFVMVAWGSAGLLRKFRYAKTVLGLSAVIVILALCICSWIQVGYWHDSIRLFEHSIEVSGDSDVMHSNLGVALSERGKIDEAIIHYRRALSIDPRDPRVHNNLGIALAVQGKFDEAMEHYYKAQEEAPEFIEVHYNMAKSLSSQGKLKEAIFHYQKVVKAEPDSEEAHFYLAKSLQQQSDFDNAILHYREVLRINSSYADAYYNIALAHQAQGNYDQAFSYFQQSLKLRPDWPLALNGLARVLITRPNAALQDVVQAMGFAERAADLTDYKVAEVLNTLSETYAAANLFDRAIETAKKGLELALSEENEKLADYIRKRLELYEQKKVELESKE
jgi:tetratricopeptide (TPR) repeat protein